MKKNIRSHKKTLIGFEDLNNFLSQIWKKTVTSKTLLFFIILLSLISFIVYTKSFKKMSYESEIVFVNFEYIDIFNSKFKADSKFNDMIFFDELLKNSIFTEQLKNNIISRNNISRFLKENKNYGNFEIKNTGLSKYLITYKDKNADIVFNKYVEWSKTQTLRNMNEYFKKININTLKYLYVEKESLKMKTTENVNSESFDVCDFALSKYNEYNQKTNVANSDFSELNKDIISRCINLKTKINLLEYLLKNNYIVETDIIFDKATPPTPAHNSDINDLLMFISLGFILFLIVIFIKKPNYFN